MPLEVGVRYTQVSWRKYGTEVHADVDGGADLGGYIGDMEIPRQKKEHGQWGRFPRLFAAAGVV
jgi:hypothetical protein